VRYEFLAVVSVKITVFCSLVDTQNLGGFPGSIIKDKEYIPKYRNLPFLPNCVPGKLTVPWSIPHILLLSPAYKNVNPKFALSKA
jgi:hypothetical protein